MKAKYVLTSLALSTRVFQKRTPLYPELFWPLEVLRRGVYRSVGLGVFCIEKGQRSNRKNEKNK